MLTVVPNAARRLLLPALITLALPGCATKEYVQQELAWVNTRLEGIENTLGHADKRINANTGRLKATEDRLGKAENDAAALDRKLGATQSELEGTNRNLAGLLVGLNAANLRIDSNVEKIQAAEQRLVRVQEDAVVINRRLDETQADLAGARQDLAGLVTGLKDAHARIDAHAASLARGMERLDAVEIAPQAAVTLGEVAVMPAPSAVPPAVPPAMASADAPPAAPVAAQARPPVAEPGRASGLLGNEMQERLNRVGVLIDEVHRRINVNTSGLQSAKMRIDELEAGLAATGQRGEASDAALKAAQEQIASAQGQLADADRRIGANTHALEQMGSHIDATAADLKAANTRLEETRQRVGELGEQLARNEAADAAVSATAKEALERALAAGKLAEGRLLMETVLSESVGFQFEQAGLGESARLALHAFADKLKAENQGVYIEIQGYTDDTGPATSNLRLSRQRAEAVRDFLHGEAGLPLHRLALAAYGESRPVADNKTREGRVLNRRVVLVVLK